MKDYCLTLGTVVKSVTLETVSSALYADVRAQTTEMIFKNTKKNSERQTPNTAYKYWDFSTFAFGVHNDNLLLLSWKPVHCLF